MATKAKPKAKRTSRRSEEPETRNTNSADALELLEQDHREVEDLFDRFDELGDDNKQKEEIAVQICTALKVHSQIEEEIFYPRARAVTKDDDLIDEALVEHATVKRLIEEIEGMQAGDELYDAKLRVLEEMVKRHIQEEEEELFPELTSVSMDTAALGKELGKRKEELMTELQR